MGTKESIVRTSSLVDRASVRGVKKGRGNRKKGSRRQSTLQGLRVVGGLLLGIFESVGPSLFLEGLGIPAPYQLKDAIAFTMLVLVLIFRPTGIMGVDLGKKKA